MGSRYAREISGMYYDTAKNDHGLRFTPLKALVAPRPIGWVSTLDGKGVANLAPFSFFNLVSDRPPCVMFSGGGPKDTWRNAQETGEFVCSLATWDLRYQMNASSAEVPPEVDEFEISKLSKAESRFVKPPRVAESPVALECKYVQTVTTPRDEKTGKIHHLVLGLVVGIYIDDRFIKNGLVDTGAMMPIARMGYHDYAVVKPENVFTMALPEVDAKGNVAGPWEKVKA
jgi:flavin reductase (DIM6/NTAB) family NADH-FMN oxidoreductase RutF